MDDVGSIHSENENLRIIRGRLLQWEAKDNPLAPITSKQQESIEILTQKWQESYEETPSNIVDIEISRSDLKCDINEVTCKSLQELPGIVRGIEKTNDFLDWYDKVNAEIHDHADGVYHKYLEQLEVRSDDCQTILQEIDLAMCKLNELNSEYNFVSNKTSSLNSASESLIQEQEKLNEINKQIQIRLHYFNQVEYLTQRLQSSTLSVISDAFLDCLNRIDECLQYLRQNSKFKDSSVFIVKYKYCQLKAIGLMKNYVTQVMSQATENVLGPKQAATVTDNANSDTAFALYYGKFQTSAIKIKRVSQMIEERIGESSEYEQLLSYIHQHYLSERATIMSPAVDKAIKDLKTNNKSDHCTMMRSACAFLVHICQDEHRLFFQFFSVASEQLNVYLEDLCTILYDTMRPYIIHINHLETLAEICSILRIEMLEEHVQQNPEPLESFAKTALQLLQDVQERLVFRANLYLQSDILNYNPSSGDLAYPEKLEMMESIALSLQEPQMRRSNSRNSMISNISSVGHENDYSDSHSMTMRNFNSPADLHGMWYPTVRRTLVCLSRLYRCVDRPIFQGLSQEALQYCIQSVSAAANKISAAKTPIDGELFEIKHLLILREQIAPFRVDFTIRETTLDFSKVKTAAYGLLQKRKQLFSMGSNNALLEFLLEGTPQVKEHLLDSRKDVDRHLKMVCESFIKNAVQMLVGPILMFLEKAQNVLADSSQTGKNRSESKAPTKINYNLRQSQWASPQQISGIIQESLRLIKSKLSTLHRSMQLYLSNRDTKSIIFRPIRLNIISAFVRLEQILTMNGYSQDDMTITSCPSSDYVSMLLLGVSEGVTVSGRKMSTSSTEGGPVSTRKPSINEKKVSFDNSVSSVREENPEIVNDSEEINPSPEAVET